MNHPGITLMPDYGIVTCDQLGRIPKQELGPVPPERKGDWMLTFGGTAYWPLDPRASEVFITDIAHSLAYQCRYGGHARDFYSVAEHSVLVSKLVPPEHALVALLHDATEAYVADVPRPLKPWLKEYEAIEGRNWLAIVSAFRLPCITLPPCVIDIDRRICLAEMMCMMPKPPLPLGIEGETPEVAFYCWPPLVAEQKFLARFYELWDNRMYGRNPAAYRGRRAA